MTKQSTNCDCGEYVTSKMQICSNTNESNPIVMCSNCNAEMRIFKKYLKPDRGIVFPCTIGECECVGRFLKSDELLVDDVKYTR